MNKENHIIKTDFLCKRCGSDLQIKLLGKCAFCYQEVLSRIVSKKTQKNIEFECDDDKKKKRKKKKTYKKSKCYLKVGKFARCNFIITKRVRNDLGRVKKAIRSRNDNYYKVDKILGYAPCDLKEHLESKFQDGMNWDNMGKWHIDHIIPIYHFVFTHGDYEAKLFSKLVNGIDNLQPLWARDNLKKSYKF